MTEGDVAKLKWERSISPEYLVGTVVWVVGRSRSREKFKATVVSAGFVVRIDGIVESVTVKINPDNPLSPPRTFWKPENGDTYISDDRNFKISSPCVPPNAEDPY